MKLSAEVLLEIVAIVQNGLVHGKDVSDALRRLDVVEQVGVDGETKLFLTEEYRETRELLR